MKRRFRNLIVKLVGSRKRQVLAGILLAGFTVALCRLITVLRVFSQIKTAVPDIVYLNYDSASPSLLNFQVAYPEMMSPLKVDFIGIKGELTLAKDDRALVAFGLNDISIDKRKPLAVDVGMMFTDVLAQELVDIFQKRVFYMCVSFVVRARICGIPMYFHKQVIHRQELPEDTDAVDFAKYADMISMSTSETCKKKRGQCGDLFGIDIYADKLKILELVHSKIKLLSTTTINTRFSGCRVFTNCGFMKLLMIDGFDFEGNTDRFIGIHIVVDRDDPEFGACVVNSIREGYLDLEILGYKRRGCERYYSQEPLFSSRRMRSKLAKKKDPQDGNAELPELHFESKLVDSDIVLTSSVKYDSRIRRAFSFAKFILPRDEKLQTRIYLMCDSGSGLAGMAALTIKPFEIGNQEIFLQTVADEGAKPDTIESASGDSSDGGVPVKFANVIIPSARREELFTVRFSKLRILELLKAYKRPVVVVDIRGEHIFSIFNGVKILVNEDFGVFLASDKGSVCMLYEGRTNQVRQVKARNRRAEHDYLMEHTVSNMLDQAKAMQCTSVMMLPSTATGASDLIRFTIPSIVAKCHCNRGVFTFDAGATELHYSRTEGRFVGKVHLVSTYVQSGCAANYLNSKELFGFFSRNSRVETNLAGNENIPLYELASILCMPSGRVKVAEGASNDERLEIRKLRHNLVKQRSAALKAHGVKRQAIVPASSFNQQHMEFCISSKFSKFYSSRGQHASQANPNKVGEPQAGGDAGTGAYIPCVIPVHVSLDESPQSLRLIKFRLLSECEDDEPDFSRQLDSFLKAHGVLQCPFFSCVKHVFKFESLHLIIDGIIDGPFKIEKGQAHGAFSSAGTPGDIEAQDGDGSSEASAEQVSEPTAGGASQFAVHGQWSEQLWKEGITWRTKEAEWMQAKLGNTRIGKERLDGGEDDPPSSGACLAPESSLGAMRDFVDSDAVGRMFSYLKFCAFDAKLDEYAPRKYVHNKTIPTAGDYVMETPADDGLVSISVVKPSIVVTVVDGLVFPHIVDSILVQVGLNNMECIRKIRKGLYFKVFNPNDTLSMLAAILLNYHVLNISSPSSDKNVECKNVCSHIQADCGITLESVREKGLLDFSASVVLPRPMLEISKYLVLDAFDVVSWQFLITSDKPTPAFEMNFTFERQDVYADDVESFAKNTGGLAALTQEHTAFTNRIVGFVDSQRELAKEYAETDETAKQLAVEYEAVYAKGSGDTGKPDVASIFDEPREDPAAVGIYSDLAFYKKYRCCVQLSFDAGASPYTCLVKSSAGGMRISSEQFSVAACYSFLNVLLFRDSCLEPLVGNGYIRTLLDPRFRETHPSVTADFLDRVCNYVRSAPLFGLDIKDVSQIEQNGLQLSVDAYSSDLERWLERKIAEVFAGMPFGVIPARMMLGMKAEVPHILALNLLNQPVIKLGGATMALSSWYDLNYPKAFANEQAALERHKKMRMMRTMVHGFTTDGAAAVPVDAKLSEIVAASSAPVVQGGKTKAGKSGTASVGASPQESGQPDVLHGSAEESPGPASECRAAEPVMVAHVSEIAAQPSDADADVFYSLSNSGDVDSCPRDDAADDEQGQSNSCDTFRTPRESESDYKSCESDAELVAVAESSGTPEPEVEQEQSQSTGWGPWFKSFFYSPGKEQPKADGSGTAKEGDRPAGNEEAVATEPGPTEIAKEERPAEGNDKSGAEAEKGDKTNASSAPNAPVAQENEEGAAPDAAGQQNAAVASHPVDPLHAQLMARLAHDGVVLPWLTSKNIAGIRSDLTSFEYGGCKWSIEEFVELYREEKIALSRTIRPLPGESPDSSQMSRRPIEITACLYVEFFAFLSMYEQSAKKKAAMANAQKKGADVETGKEKLELLYKLMCTKVSSFVDTLCSLLRQERSTEALDKAACHPSGEQGGESQTPPEQIEAIKTSNDGQLALAQPSAAPTGAANNSSGDLPTPAQTQTTAASELQEHLDLLEESLKKLIVLSGTDLLFDLLLKSAAINRYVSGHPYSKYWWPFVLRFRLRDMLVMLYRCGSSRTGSPIRTLLCEIAYILQRYEPLVEGAMEMYLHAHPQIDYISDMWLRYVYSSLKPRHWLPVPLVVRHVQGHMLYLDLHVPLRFYFINSKSFTLSFSSSNRVMVAAKFSCSSNARSCSRHGFTMSIPVLVRPEEGVGGVKSEKTKEIVQLSVHKPAENDYVIALLAYLDRSDEVGRCMEALTLGLRLAAHCPQVLYDLGVKGKLIMGYDEFSIGKYYDLRSGMDYSRYLAGLVYFDREALGACHMSDRDVTNLVRIHKKCLDASLVPSNAGSFGASMYRLTLELAKCCGSNLYNCLVKKPLGWAAGCCGSAIKKTASVAHYAGTAVLSNAKRLGTAVASKIESWIHGVCGIAAAPLDIERWTAMFYKLFYG